MYKANRPPPKTREEYLEEMAAWPNVLAAFDAVAQDFLAQMREEITAAVALVGVRQEDVSSADRQADAIFERYRRRALEALSAADRDPRTGPPAGPLDPETGLRAHTPAQSAAFGQIMSQYCPDSWLKERAAAERGAYRLRVAGSAYRGLLELDALTAHTERSDSRRVEHIALASLRILRSVEGLAVSAARCAVDRPYLLRELSPAEKNAVRIRVATRFSRFDATMRSVVDAKPWPPGTDRPRDFVDTVELRRALAAGGWADQAAAR